MPHKGPHISIAPDFVVNRILRIELNDFRQWPQAVREFAIEIAEELFLVVYNPFVDAGAVRASVRARFAREVFALAHHFATSIGEGITLFWSGFEAETTFRNELVERLRTILPESAIVTRPGALVECATDATDLRMELPLLVVEPGATEQISQLVRLANEMKFALIPSGGASGMTGGAIPVRKRSVVVRLTRLTRMEAVDVANMTITLEAGVITQNAVLAAARDGFLLTLDPASRSASTIGGNIAENSGGPCAFEYGTTLDNLLAWRMVTPTGEVIDVVRQNHPRHKILPSETAVFEVRDVSGGVRNVVELQGNDIRLPGLGKDVTDKALGGLPGMQKEGVDGIIISGTFVVHPRPLLSRVMVLEFYGPSMHEAAVVIGEIVALRDRIRQNGDYARLSALEEFNAKYVQAISYERKSLRHKGLPISVIILQVDGDEAPLLERCVSEIAAIVGDRDTVALMVAADDKEAELFWEDRHHLSAIARRTSGFKINEDVVIPMNRMPDFALFLEGLNRRCAAMAYRRALQETGRIRGIPADHAELIAENAWAAALASKGLSPWSEPVLENLPAEGGIVYSDDDIEAHAILFFEELGRKYPGVAERLADIRTTMCASRVMVASHMHAGDGNCHVNIPVNSNDLEMLELAEDVAVQVMTMAQHMGGAVSGEHGIGITKLAFLGQEKMEAIRAFKARVDPRDVFNPAKLTQRELPVRPFTFSFNRLINDLRESGLPDTERLIRLLSTVQICTRCGKCKEVCPMLYPERSLHYHPRNKNMVLGAIVEAIYYSQVTTGRIHPAILAGLRDLVEHCTGCGRCTAVCPVKIPSADVALDLRAFLEDEGAGGHPIKRRVLSWLVKKPTVRVPQMAKIAALGQQVQNRVLDVVPGAVRRHMQSPLFSGKGPALGYGNLYESLHLHRGGLFVPVREGGLQNGEEGLPEQNGHSDEAICNAQTVDTAALTPAQAESADREAVLYFPGCGGSLFSRSIGLSTLALLLESGVAVVMPENHICCGYPLLASGASTAFEQNRQQVRAGLLAALNKAEQAGFVVNRVVTACGSCRAGLERHELAALIEEVFGPPQPLQSAPGDALAPTDAFQLTDAVHFALPQLGRACAEAAQLNREAGLVVMQHLSCHAEGGSPTVRAARAQSATLGELTGTRVCVHAGCCGESGMGAMSSPQIYNELRQRKRDALAVACADYPKDAPVLVTCPSCKVGIARIFLQQHEHRPVLHVAEWLAKQAFAPRWGQKWYRVFRSRIARKADAHGVRRVRMGD